MTTTVVLSQEKIRQDPTFENLKRICVIANREALKECGHRSTCILTSAALHYALSELGYMVRPVRIRASVHSQGPKQYGVVLGSDGDGERLPKAKKDHWHGHLAVVVNEEFLVDATVDQTVEAESWIKMGPFVGRVTPRWLAGQESLSMRHGNAHLSYSMFHRQTGFRSAPDWERRSHWMRIAQKILRSVLAVEIDSQDEVWKPIEGCSGYEVSSYGNIRSYWQRQSVKGKQATFTSVLMDTPHLRKPCPNGDGYFYVSICRGKTANRICPKIHRLVAQAFIPNPNNWETVNHKNGIKSDNRVVNLEWKTRRGNMEHAREMGWRDGIFPSGSRWLTEKRQANFARYLVKVPEIRRRAESGESFRSIAKDLGFSQQAVSDIAQRKSWAHVE